MLSNFLRALKYVSTFGLSSHLHSESTSGTKGNMFSLYKVIKEIEGLMWARFVVLPTADLLATSHIYVSSRELLLLLERYRSSRLR